MSDGLFNNPQQVLDCLNYIYICSNVGKFRGNNLYLIEIWFFIFRIFFAQKRLKMTLILSK